ncbi:MAG TPA: hypothetical protein VFB52_07160 [Solirubrobacterales bacterium]|nr:hypothetical protein [Solirubrobacterales bacterium]
MSERPGTGDVIAGVAGFILLLSLFVFSWFGIEDFGLDAFEALDDWVGIILIFAAFSGLALALFGNDVPRADAVPLATVVLALGALSVLVILIQIIAPPSVTFGPASADLDPEFGTFLGMVCAIALAIGGYLTLQEEDALGGSYGAPAAAPSAPVAPPAAQPPQTQVPPQQPAPPQQQAPPPPPPQPPAAG